jgi:molybdenum cofactor biosynthesis enzyme MoaA
LFLDAVDIIMVLLPRVKDEILVKFIDWFADLKLVYGFLEFVKICANSSLNERFYLGV